MENIRVSIICLAYNHEKYIRSALDGFVKQKTNFVFEVLIHDDASKDNTPEIIREYEDLYPDIIKPIYQKENQYSKKIPITKEILLPIAKGDYIAFCEGDDFWVDEYKLQKQFDALETHSECSISVHRVDCVNEDNTYNERTIPDKRLGLCLEMILNQKKLCELYWIDNKYPFHTSSYFVRKSCLSKNLAFSRDTAVLRMCLNEGCAYYFNDVMSKRRLWTENNFNSRLRDQGEQGKIWLMLDAIRIDDSFDCISNNKFKKYTDFGRLECILNIANYDSQQSKELLKKYNLNFIDSTSVVNGERKLKCFIKYVLLKILSTKKYNKIIRIYSKFNRLDG